MTDAWKIDGRIWTPEAVREMEARIAALEAERDRLRAALGRIAHGRKVFCRDGHEEAYHIARAALEGGEG